MRGTKPHLIVDNGAVRKAPTVPSWMGKAAKAEWKRIIPVLIERRILTKADIASLENYCVCIGQVRDCEALLQRDGPVVTEDGKIKRHPASIVQSDAMNRSRQLAGELGLTPVSRSRPSIRDDADDDDGLVLA